MSNTMVGRTRKTGAILVFMLVFGIVLGVLPAMASAASTAFVNVHNVLAGQDSKVFTIRVNNTEPTGVGGTAVGVGKTIREVRVFPPLDLIDAVLAGSSGPAPFTDVRVIGDPPAEIRFRAPANQGLVPGGNATFTIAADVRDTITRDRTSDWTVRVSDNALAASQGAAATAEGLTTTLRVLQVQSVAVLAPTGAADDRDGDGNPEITGTQGNVCVRTTVYNAAATALDVTPDLTAGSTTVGDARPAATPPCSAATVASASIPGKQTREFDFLLTANDVGSKTTSELVGTASATNASTPNTPDPDDDDFNIARGLVIEPKAKFIYNTNTLAPRAVRPSDPTQNPPFVNTETFSIGFNKSPAGSPPLGQISGDFASQFCNATLSVPTSLPEGAQNDQTASFNSCQIAPLPDGRYQPTVRIGYTDGNGLVQAPVQPENALERVRLDHLIPDVDVDIVPPPVEVTAVPPVDPAVSHGRAFSATGTATDVSPESGEDTPCGPNPPGNTAPLPCTLVSAKLLQYPLTADEGGGTAFARKIDVTNRCSLSSSGNVSCNITLSGTGDLKFDTGTFSTALEVIVKDETGSLSDPGSSLSPLVDVDIIAPFIAEAAASRGGTLTLPGDQQVQGQRRTVAVTFNEPVQNSNNPQDWRVQEGGQTIAVCAVNQSADMRTVQLITCTELPADPEGIVSYDPSLPTSSPYHDRVGEETATPLTKPLVDRIAPLAPTFLTVNGRPVQDGAFYFNTTSPEVVLSDGAAPADDPAIAEGYTVELYRESNSQPGLQRVGDTLCGSDGATDDGDAATEITATLSCTVPNAEGLSKIYAVSLDTATPTANVGDISLADFILDLTRPEFVSAAVSGAAVTVTLSEPLYSAGRNSGNDWNFFATNNATGERQNIALGTVTAPTTRTRSLAINDGRWTSSAYTPNEVRYRFDGETEDQRYDDRAGNKLNDGNVGFGA
jgi:hypothetical protein